MVVANEVLETPARPTECSPDRRNTSRPGALPVEQVSSARAAGNPQWGRSPDLPGTRAAGNPSGAGLQACPATRPPHHAKSPRDKQVSSPANARSHPPNQNQSSTGRTTALAVVRGPGAGPKERPPSGRSPTRPGSRLTAHGSRLTAHRPPGDTKPVTLLSKKLLPPFQQPNKNHPRPNPQPQRILLAGIEPPVSGRQAPRRRSHEIRKSDPR